MAKKKINPDEEIDKKEDGEVVPDEVVPDEDEISFVFIEQNKAWRIANGIQGE